MMRIIDAVLMDPYMQVCNELNNDKERKNIKWEDEKANIQTSIYRIFSLIKYVFRKAKLRFREEEETMKNEHMKRLKLSIEDLTGPTMEHGQQLEQQIIEENKPRNIKFESKKI